jgi:hypothetical protein
LRCIGGNGTVTASAHIRKGDGRHELNRQDAETAEKNQFNLAADKRRYTQIYLCKNPEPGTRNPEQLYLPPMNADRTTQKNHSSF